MGPLHGTFGLASYSSWNRGGVGEIIYNKLKLGGYIITTIKYKGLPGQGRMPTPPSIIHLSTLTFLPSFLPCGEWVGGLGTYIGLSFCCPFTLLGGFGFGGKPNKFRRDLRRWRNRTPVLDDVATGLCPGSERSKMGSE